MSVEEIVREVSSLKMSSGQLAIMFSSAGQSLQGSTNQIASIVRGSRSGQEAVAALGIATKSLLDAAASISTMERSCDDCIAQLSR